MVIYGGYGSPALVHHTQHEPTDSSSGALLHPDIADSCSIGRRGEMAGYYYSGDDPSVYSQASLLQLPGNWEAEQSHRMFLNIFCS